MDNFLCDIATFVGDDEARAREVFDQCLHEPLTRFLANYLRNYLDRQEARDDVALETKLKIWRHRTSMEFQTVPHWWACVARIAKNSVIDHIRKEGKDVVEDDEIDRIPDTDWNYLHAIAEVSVDQEQLYAYADGVWLGLDPDIPLAERNRRKLVAKLFYLEKRSWEEICEMPLGGEPLTRETLDDWLKDLSTFSCLAYGELYYDNSKLTGTILRPSNPLTEGEQEKLTTQARTPPVDPPLPDWSWTELQLTMLRYRNGLGDDKILQMRRETDRQTLEALVAKCQGRMPFAGKARRLAGTAQIRRVPGDPLIRKGLWRRLTVQYFLADELPLGHIFERVEPAAREVGVEYTKNTIHAGISNGRFFSELAAYVARRQK